MLRFWVLLLAMAALASCGDDDSDKGLTETERPVAQLVPAETLSVIYGTVAEGSCKSQEVVVRNTGNAPLEVAAITLDYTPPADAEEDPSSPAVSLSFPEGAPPVTIQPFADTEETYPFVVTICNLGDGLTRDATVTVTHDDLAQGGTSSLLVQGVSGAPRMRIADDVIDFGLVSAGSVETYDVLVTNAGSEDLSIESLLLTGNEGYSVTIAGQTTTPSDEGEATVLSPAVLVGPEETEVLTVTYAPSEGTPATGSLLVYSNDPTLPEGYLIEMVANGSVPCLTVNPGSIDFGGIGVGSDSSLPIEVRTCGLAPVSITDVVFGDCDPGETICGDFALDLSTLGDMPPSGDAPLVLTQDDPARIFMVKYTPDVVNPKDEMGSPIPDVGTVTIVNDSFYSDIDVSVRGIGVELVCPVAVISVLEGEEVVPQTNLHLSGEQSYSPNGPITYYEWTVVEPDGSQSIFIPSASFPNPTFEVNVAGEYVFGLVVRDDENNESCVPAEQVVVVIPDEAIHVELTWVTPSDPDETDTGDLAGSDMDLHFAHPFAKAPDLDGDGEPDPWFDIPYDCFWFNPVPNWGSFSSAAEDDPSLDRDDTDGAGPENVNLDHPEGDATTPWTYRIAAHYWDDHEFGPVFASVSVYIYSELVYSATDVKLGEHDLWDVGTLSWPDGVVTPSKDVFGDYLITPMYIPNL